MDKKDIKELIKLLTKIYLILITITCIPLNLIITLFYSLSNGNFLYYFISNMKNTFIAFTMLVALVYIGMFLISIFLKQKRKKDTINSDKYIRELPKYFPPAIASFLLDLNLETTTDYTATIAYLISKKYIKFKENNIDIINSNIDSLSLHEQYVFNCITKQNKYNQEEFIKLVMSDAEQMNLIQKGRRKIHFLRNICINLILFFLLGFLYNDVFTTGILNQLVGILGFISEISIFAIIGYSIYLLTKYQHENYHRTKLGYIESQKWSGVKRYLHEFTLISEKNINDIILLDDYIPYSIALNEAQNIEKFIEENNIYRQLIYGKTYGKTYNIFKEQ